MDLFPLAVSFIWQRYIICFQPHFSLIQIAFFLRTFFPCWCFLGAVCRTKIFIDTVMRIYYSRFRLTRQYSLSFTKGCVSFERVWLFISMSCRFKHEVRVSISGTDMFGKCSIWLHCSRVFEDNMETFKRAGWETCCISDGAENLFLFYLLLLKKTNLNAKCFPQFRTECKPLSNRKFIPISIFWPRV